MIWCIRLIACKTKKNQISKCIGFGFQSVRNYRIIFAGFLAPNKQLKWFDTNTSDNSIHMQSDSVSGFGFSCCNFTYNHNEKYNMFISVNIWPCSVFSYTMQTNNMHMCALHMCTNWIVVERPVQVFFSLFYTTI